MSIRSVRSARTVRTQRADEKYAHPEAFMGIQVEAACHSPASARSCFGRTAPIAVALMRIAAATTIAATA